MRILIIEDEVQVARLLKRGLSEEGYDVEICFNGTTANVLASEKKFDLIILDIILPDTSGHELCAKLRGKGLNVPVMMLTALGTLDDKVRGLDAGADDYLVKPFEFDELLARIKALLRRSSGLFETSKLKIGDLLLDLEKKTATRAETSINLTGKEFELLEFLIRNKGKVLSRAEIAEKLWDFSFDTGTNVIDVYISILRKKIDKDYNRKLIRTKFGSGYFIEE
jgi:two-component system, OmpR family, copper resistance phosphate regulon response regulator CusR